MDKDQKNRLDGLQQYTIPAAKYFWISGPEIALHKGFLKYYSMAMFCLGIALTLVTIYTSFWSFIAVASYDFFIVKLWYITFPALGIAAGFFYIKHERKMSRKHKDDLENMRRRQVEDAYIKQSQR